MTVRGYPLSSLPVIKGGNSVNILAIWVWAALSWCKTFWAEIFVGSLLSSDSQRKVNMVLNVHRNRKAYQGRGELID